MPSNHAPPSSHYSVAENICSVQTSAPQMRTKTVYRFIMPVQKRTHKNINVGLRTQFTCSTLAQTPPKVRAAVTEAPNRNREDRRRKTASVRRCSSPRPYTKRFTCRFGVRTFQHNAHSAHQTQRVQHGRLLELAGD